MPTAAPSTRRLQMEADGADIIDIGGESTRPGAEPVSADEESRAGPAGRAGAGWPAAGADLDRHLQGGGRRGGPRRRRRHRERRQRAALRSGAGGVVAAGRRRRWC